MTQFSLRAAFAGDNAPAFDWCCAGGEFANADASGISVGIDGHLTNCADLARSLGLGRECTPAQLVREGWLRWGQELPDRLRGSFVVAVMDRRQKRFFLARDALGIVPVCYAVVDEALLVAEGSRAIRAMMGEGPAIDLAQLANFIAGTEGDRSRTFYRGISRLPPGHWLDFWQGGPTISAYWTPARASGVQGAFPDLVDRFVMLFDEALRHAYVPNKTGLLLSGGLDSSMIAGSLAKVLGAGPDVTAVSMTYRRTSDWHDGQHLDALSASLPFTFAAVPCDTHDPLSDLSSQLEALDGPWLSYGHSVTLHAMRSIAQKGIPIVLNGHAGDEVVSYGFGRLNELAMNGQWYELWRLAPVAAALQHESRWDVFSYYLDHVRPVRAIRQRWRRLKNAKPGGKGQGGLLNDDAMRLVHDAFGPPNRPAMQYRHHDERSLHEAALSSPLQAGAFEVLAHASRAIGVETRMPFADRDLVEFSLGLPSSTKLDRGFSRSILREAMRGRVPESVRLRSDKFDFGPAFVRGMMKDPASIHVRLAQAQDRLGDLINPEACRNLQAHVAGAGAQIDVQVAMDIWRLIVAGMWLGSINKNGADDAVPSAVPFRS